MNIKTKYNFIHNIKLDKDILLSPFSILFICVFLMMINSSCKDALGLDPNIKQTLLKQKESIVRDTVYLYPGSLNDSSYVIIIRYQNEKDSLQKVIDSLRNFYYPKLNPNVINIDSNIFTEKLFYKNSIGFEQNKLFKWNFNTQLLNVRLDTLENWPVATVNYHLIENAKNVIKFEHREYFIKSLKINTNRIGLLQSKELKSNEIDTYNNYEIIVSDSNGNIFKNPEFISNFRIWFTDLSINRLNSQIIRHSFSINLEAVISGSKSKTVFRGSTFVNYY